MKKHTYLLLEQDPDGRTGEVTTTLVAILGGDTKEEIERLALRTIAKHMAGGDYTRIARIEECISEDNRARIREFLAGEDDGVTIEQDSWFFTLLPLAIDIWPRSSKKDMGRYMLSVRANEETGEYSYVDQVEEETACRTYMVDIADMDSMDSPFIYASPFIVRDKDLYVVDVETGEESGPYSRAEWEGEYYTVRRDGKAGLVSITGKPITDCIYDSAISINGIGILTKDGNDGLYSPEHDLIIPCEYDSIECMPEDRVYVIAVKDGVQGLIATDGTFHPETDEDPDDSYEYL